MQPIIPAADPVRTLHAVVLFLICPAVAHAQREDSVPARVHELQPVMVTVSRLEAERVPLARLPFAAQVLRVDDLPDPAASTAADLLRGMAGVSFADQFGSPFQQDLRFRGFQTGPVVGYPQGVSVFVDGVRVNEADASQVYFNLIPLQAVERVEVVRAPGGPFGRNTMAGAVNFVTRSGRGAPAGALSLRAGSFGERHVAGWAAASTGAGYHLLVSARAHESEGWRALNSARLAQFFTKGGWRNETTEISIAYTFADDHIEAPGSLPSTWLAGDLPYELAGTDDPRRLQFTGFEGDWFAPRLDFLVADFKGRLAAGYEIGVHAFRRANQLTQFNDNITEPNVRGETGIVSLGAAGQLSWRGATGSVVSGGAELVSNRVEIGIFEEPNPAFPEAGGRTEEVSSRDRNIAAFASAWLAISPVIGLTAAARYDHIDLPITDHLDPEHSGENSFSEPSGSLGLDWAPLPGFRVFASWGRGFRAPVILEITCADPEDPCPLPFELGADPPLHPVTTTTWQGGARARVAAGVDAEVIGYLAAVRNELFAVIGDPPTRGYFMNLDRTERRGLEFSFDARLASWMRVEGALALTRATFQSHATLASALADGDEIEAPAGGDHMNPSTDDGDPGTRVSPGDHFAMVPAITASSAVSLLHGGWALNTDAEYVGPQYLVGDENNRREFGRLGSRILLSATLERSLGSVRISVIARNLLDSAHETFGIISPNVRGPDERPQPFLSPGLPRRVTVALTYAF